MENDILLEKLKSTFANNTSEQGADWPELSIESNQLIDVITELKSNPEFNFNYLFCLTCVDWKTHFNMVYHLSSTTHRHSLVVKAKVDRANPEIETLANLYKTAEFHEREVFDLFGIHFKNHPDLRRLLLTDDWVGYPLRKDYEDPINMIKL